MAIRKYVSQGLCSFLLAHWIMVFYFLALPAADYQDIDHPSVWIKQHDGEQRHPFAMLQAQTAEDDSEEDDDRFALLALSLKSETRAYAFLSLLVSCFDEGFFVFRTGPPIYLLLENFRC